MTNLQAGVSRVTITPPVGVYLVGMERTENSQGLRDDLYATALAVSDGVTEAVIVSCDLLVVHPDLVRRVRRDASARTGVPGEHMMFCATHCHSGPGTYAFPDSWPIHRAYVDNLGFLLSGLIKMAHDRLSPVEFGFGRGIVRIGINRRLTRPDGVTVIAANPDGPTDPEVGVLRVDTADGQPMAVVVNYACHPVVLGNGSNVISADWPGAMRRAVERVTGAKCMFVQGAAADINPLPGEPCDREEVLERLGMEVGEEAAHVWVGIEGQRAEGVAVSGERLEVPLLPPSQYEGQLPKFVELDEFATELTWDEFQAQIRSTTPWTAKVAGEGDDRRAVVELQAIRIGDAAIVAAAGEIFVKTGSTVKGRSPIANAMFAAYTNGSAGYFPPLEDYPRGGYEVSESYLFYRLPAPIAPQAAGMVEETALRLLGKVAS